MTLTFIKFKQTGDCVSLTGNTVFSTGNNIVINNGQENFSGFNSFSIFSFILGFIFCYLILKFNNKK